MSPVPVLRSGSRPTEIAAGIFGFLWFLAWAGQRVLDPTNLDWLMSGEDWTQHLMGWLFFRNAPPGFPLGRIEGLVYPLGTTLGYTDSTPWVSLLLRPLSPMLPADFQFIGPWLALCFFLQGFFGARLASAFTRDRVAILCAGVMFATSPVLIARVGHDSLCAQWMIVALLGLHARPAPGAGEARRQLLAALGLTVLSAATHPYLAVMVLGLSLALVLKLARVDRSLRWHQALLAGAAIPLATLLVFAALGYFGGGVTTGNEGFSRFNSDLLSLFNPRGKARLMPDLPSSVSWFEGYGYLGLGGLALLAFAVVSFLSPVAEPGAIQFHRAWPAALVALLFAFYALGPAAKLGAQTLVRLEGMYSGLEAITGPFRSCGRFVWVLHYAVLAASMAVILRAWRSRPGVAVTALVAAVVLQLIDFDFKPGNMFHHARIDAGLRSPVWNGLGTEYRHLAMVPPQMAWMGEPCEGELPGEWRWPFAYLAYRQKMTFNSGYVARMNRDALFASCEASNAAFRRGELDPSTVYISGPKSLEALKRSGAQAVCGRVDRHAVCVSAQSQGPTRRYLESHPL